jgi:hypothetical protein
MTRGTEKGGDERIEEGDREGDRKFYMFKTSDESFQVEFVGPRVLGNKCGNIQISLS